MNVTFSYTVEPLTVKDPVGKAGVYEVLAVEIVKVYEPFGRPLITNVLDSDWKSEAMVPLEDVTTIFHSGLLSPFSLKKTG